MITEHPKEDVALKNALAKFTLDNLGDMNQEYFERQLPGKGGCMETVLVGTPKNIMKTLNGIPKPETRTIRLEIEVPLKDIWYDTKPQLAVNVMSENQDRVEGNDVTVNALWLTGIDENGNRVKVNVIDAFGQSDVEDKVFCLINNC